MGESEYGRHTREALRRLAARQGVEVSGLVHMTHQPELPGVTASLGDRSRELYEQVGTLYTFVSASDGPVAATEELADFLATVTRALAAPSGPTAAALTLALRRYETDRTGERS